MADQAAGRQRTTSRLSIAAMQWLCESKDPVAARARSLMALLGSGRGTGVAASLLIGFAGSVLLIALTNVTLERWIRSSFSPVMDRPSLWSTIPPKQDRRQSAEQVSIRTQTDPSTTAASLLANAPWIDGSASSRKGGRVLASYRYEVKKNLETVALIEVRRERSGWLLLGPRIALVADIAMRDDSQSGQSWVRVPWWQTNDLARSNVIAEISGLWPKRHPRFPTSQVALLSWMKEHWVDIVRSANPAMYDSAGTMAIRRSVFEKVVLPELARVLGEDFGHVQTATPVFLVRTLNGWIQLLTFTTALAALLIIGARWLVFVWGERHYVILGSAEEHERASQVHGVRTWWHATEKINGLQADHLNCWDRSRQLLYSPGLAIWSAALAAIRPNPVQHAGQRVTFDYSQVPSFLDSFAALELARLTSYGAVLRFLVAAIPGLGFIGTIVGIGDALMGTGSVLSEELAKQQSGVAKVALSLGLAFDTTLVALVLSLTVGYVAAKLSAAEEATVQRAQRACLELFVKHPTPTAGATQPPSPVRVERSGTRVGARAAPPPAPLSPTPPLESAPVKPLPSQPKDKPKVAPRFPHPGRGRWWKVVRTVVVTTCLFLLLRLVPANKAAVDSQAGPNVPRSAPEPEVQLPPR